MTEPAFIAVDWGTSSFRMWLMDRGGAVLGERRSGEGMTAAASTGFAQVFNGHAAALGAPANIPAIICGMAGARQGWIEAGYIDTPAALLSIPDGAVRIPGESRDIRILPGLAQRAADAPDVIRGEETQLMGALAAIPSGGTVCMPGTHSKWVRVEGQTVSGFSTFITGELFAAICGHTVLSHAVAGAAAFSESDPAFTRALLASYKSPQTATSRLFTARSGQLLHGISATDAKAVISGTLIGLEIAGALSAGPPPERIVLVGDSGLGKLYEGALNALSLPFTTIPADGAVRSGLTAAAARLWPEIVKPEDK